jgi:aryl-alcohol dehydrogenase-like predicted oxidoreductase
MATLVKLRFIVLGCMLAVGAATRRAAVRMGATAPMRYRPLGGSGISVSECCLGTMTWGSQNTDDEAFEQLERAWEAGVNFLDTAEGYPIPLNAETQGATDRAIAKWMRATRRPRDSVVLATKICGYNERFDWFRGGPTRINKAQLEASVDASLVRLKTDHLDLLQLHWPDRYVPIFGKTRYDVSKVREDAVSFSEQVETLGALIASGKVRAWGLSNETPYGVCAFAAECDRQGVPRPASVQNSYSLLQRADEQGLVEAMLALGVGHLPYSPLSAGVLSNKYQGARAPPAGSRLQLFAGYFESYTGTRAPDAVAAYAQLAAAHGLSPSAFAIAFCASRPFVDSTIIGATTLAQLDDNLAGFGVAWTAEMEAGVEAILATYPDPWNMKVRGGG